LYKGNKVVLETPSESTKKIPLTDASGSFEVVASTKTGADFRAHGRLVNAKGYFKFQDTDNYWMKGGADSPENLLAYEDFDGTYRMKAADRDGESKASELLHSYTPHLKDWNKEFGLMLHRTILPDLMLVNWSSGKYCFNTCSPRESFCMPYYRKQRMKPC